MDSTGLRVTDVRFHEVSCHMVEKVAELSENT